MTAVLAPAEATDHARGAPRWRRIALALPAYLPALMIAIGGWQHRWMDEDAFINLRIVDQIFAGHGPVFNAGERVEAATSTLWIVVLVVGRALFGAFASMEWITLLASLGGRGRRVRRRRARRRGSLHRGRATASSFPVGLILVAAVAVVWDFSTSGLEMGLVWLWIAASWYVLDHRRARPARSTGADALGFGVMLGLAPLVRPDLTLMMLCLLVAWFVLVRPRRIVLRPRRDLRAARRVPDLPHGLLRDRSCPPPRSPRTRAGSTSARAGRTRRTSSGRTGCGSRAILIVATIVYRAPRAAATAASRSRPSAMLAAGLVARALHHRDRRRLHARPAAAPGVLRARRCPASIAVRVARSPPHRGVVGITALAVVWALVSIVRVPAAAEPAVVPRSARSATSAHGVGRQAASDRHAVRPQRQRRPPRAYASGVRGYFKLTDKQPRPGLDPERVRAHARLDRRARVRRRAHGSGSIDIGGLAEPLAARTAPVPGRPAGHRKQIDDAWYDARFGATERRSPKDVAARHALTCGPIPGLLEAVDAKLTPGRFFSNIWHSVSYTRLHVPSDPTVAEREWC